MDDLKALKLAPSFWDHAWTYDRQNKGVRRRLTIDYDSHVFKVAWERDPEDIRGVHASSMSLALALGYLEDHIKDRIGIKKQK